MNRRKSALGAAIPAPAMRRTTASDNPEEPKRQPKPPSRRPSLKARAKLRSRAARKIKRARGAPSLYTPEVAAAICHDIAIGHTVAQAARNAGIAPKTIFAWRLQHADFGELYARAKAAQMDYFAEELIEIADDGSNEWIEREGKPALLNREHVQRSQLRVDTRKWLMSKLAAQQYRDRQELTGPGGTPLFDRLMNMTDAQRIAEARSRAKRLRTWRKNE